MPQQRAKLTPFPQREPLAPLARAYLTACEAEGLSPSTLHDYEHRLRWFQTFLEAHKLPPTVESLSVEAVRAFLGLLRGHPAEWNATTGRGGTKPLSPFTVRGYVRVLKAFCRWLVEEGQLPRDPLERLPMPKAPRLVPKSLTDGEAERLLSTLKDASARDRAVVLLMLGSGLRAGEVCALTLESLATLDQSYLVAHGKGDKERLVPVEAATADALNAYLRQRGRQPGPLFLGLGGYPLQESGLHTGVRRLGEKADIKGLHPHRLRHSFARLWISRGGDAVSLQHILGHSSVAMSAHYARLWGQDVVRLHRELGILAGLLPQGKRSPRRK